MPWFPQAVVHDGTSQLEFAVDLLQQKDNFLLKESIYFQLWLIY
jgi:hypothetical protein